MHNKVPFPKHSQNNSGRLRIKISPCLQVKSISKLSYSLYYCDLRDQKIVVSLYLES